MKVGEDIKDMIRKDISLCEINRKTGIAKSTLYHHYKKIKGRKYKLVQISEEDKEKIGEFMGVFAGDGNYYFDKNKYQYKIRIYSGYYEGEYANHLKNFLTELFSKIPRVYSSSKSRVIVTEYYSKDIYYLIQKYLVWGDNKTKTVRLREIQSLDKSFLIGFLRGLFDTDGGIHKPKNKVAFGTASEKLAYQIKDILSLLGMKPGFYKYKNKDFWYIDIYGKRTDRFMMLIRPNNPNKIINRLTQL